MNSKGEQKIILEHEDFLRTYKLGDRGLKILSQYNGWLPLRSSVKLAGIVADLMGDGHLQDKPKLRLDYTSNSIIELERFNKEIFVLFGISGKIRKCTTNKYGTMNLGINNKPLARVLSLIGVPTGCKVLKEFQIPEWILKDKLLFSRFINRLFSCEGTVDIKNKYIELTMMKSIEKFDDCFEFFDSIKYYLYFYFKIKTTKPFTDSRINTRKYGIKTKAIRIKIKNKESLKKFHTYIGIENLNKNQKLLQIIK